MTPKPQKLLSVLFVLLLTAIALTLFAVHPSTSTLVEAASQPVNGRIAYMDGNALHTVNNDGTGDQTLISDSQNETPSWKPDGTKIAFGRRPNGDPTFGIFTINPDGSGVQKVSTNPSNDTHPTWSPDGTRIAFADSTGALPEIGVMNADGSNRLKLTNNSATDIFPAWSPDGTRIAFVSDRDSTPGNFEIYVMNAD